MRLPAVVLAVLLLGGCRSGDGSPGTVVLHWYTFHEPSGAFREAARRCSEASGGAYRIEIARLPADADQQREQLVRRLAARDDDIDLMAMDVIWTAEFARAGWILPWPDEAARSAVAGRLESAVESASYDGRLWAAPFTSNVQLLWYRTDRVASPPRTWDEMLAMAGKIGRDGTILAQGERYEGLSVLFLSLLASAGGTVLDPSASEVALPRGPTLRALDILRRYATSPAAPAALSTMREDQARLEFEAGGASFMVNYPFVWPSARTNAPEIAAHMGWARWPSVIEGRPSRVTLGGVNLGVGAWSRHAAKAFAAAACLASEPSQRLAAVRGGLLPSSEALYDDPEIRRAFPFADVVRVTLRDAVQRPRTPVYTDVSLAVSHTLHPLREIDPAVDLERLRSAIARALRSEGLL